MIYEPFLLKSLVIYSTSDTVLIIARLRFSKDELKKDIIDIWIQLTSLNITVLFCCRLFVYLNIYLQPFFSSWVTTHDFNLGYEIWTKWVRHQILYRTHQGWNDLDFHPNRLLTHDNQLTAFPQENSPDNTKTHLIMKLQSANLEQ